MCAEQLWSLVSPQACTRVREAEAVAQAWCRRRCPGQRGADPGRLSLLSSALTVLGPLSSLQLEDETDFPLAKESADSYLWSEVTLDLAPQSFERH